ncbi:hypothetical protein GCM10023149_44840 [Mucilaginibacter gynuensis]|uniref:HTH hxlR-type domain-containing protein n=2 Tax=Mucilaginibacter gynuensis TaxID=1302236 RepID=A0ABP8H9T1_9SPHI
MTRTMATIGTKWKPIIIFSINTGRLRFGQLDTNIPLITRKVLTEQLKELEEDGLVLRESFIELPPRVEYTLTEQGLALLPILRSMCDWVVNFEQSQGIQIKKRAQPVVT